MKIYIINLKRRTDRKEKILEQLQNLGITNYEFIEAIDGQDYKDVNEIGNVKLMKRHGFELSKNEAASGASHRLAYQKIIDSGERGIIFEDDVIIDEKFTEMINIDIPDKVDLLLYGYFTSNTRNEHSKEQSYPYEIMSQIKTEKGDNSICYFKNEFLELNGYKYYKIDEHSYNVDMVHGAHAYSPSIEFCKLLSTIQHKIIYPADDIWNHLKCFDPKLVVNYYALLKPLVYQNTTISSDLVAERQKKHHSDYIVQRMSRNDFGI